MHTESNASIVKDNIRPRQLIVATDSGGFFSASFLSPLDFLVLQKLQSQMLEKSESVGISMSNQHSPPRPFFPPHHSIDGDLVSKFGLLSSEMQLSIVKELNEVTAVSDMPSLFQQECSVHSICELLDRINA